MRKKGFTLVEVMVAILVSTVVCGGIYGIWSEVTRRVSLSSAKQRLQNELRIAASYMQKDFKSIKSETFNVKNQNPEGTAFILEFERFTDEEDSKKLAQDITEKMTYVLNNRILTRTGSEGTKILSSNVESVFIDTAVGEGNLDALALEATDEDFRAGREAQLDISITGMLIAKGLGKEVYHVERTSLVMRDEYYKKTNKTYVSNFELAEVDIDDLVQVDDSQDGLLFPGSALTKEMLMAMDLAQLEGMSLAQQELLKQAQASLSDMNETIDGTKSGEGLGSKILYGALFWIQTDGKLIRGLRSDLSSANTVEKAKEVKKKLESHIGDKDLKFKKDSIKGYENMSGSQKKIFEEAYEKKLQDRTLLGSYELIKKQAEKDGKTVPERPDTNIDALKNPVNTIYEDGDGNVVSVELDEETKEYNRKVAEAYEKIDLDWMGEFSKETTEVKVYNSAKNLVFQAESKITMLEMRDVTQENLDLIEEVKKIKK